MKTKGYALITTGGTSVRLDAVRKIGNDADGGLGVRLANMLADRGIPVVLAHTELAALKHRINPRIKCLPFETYREYVHAIRQAVQTLGPPRYAFSAAAVSDFGPAKESFGKLDSDAEVELNLTPLPKEIGAWRGLFGRECFIAGFKLQTHLCPREKLLAMAGEMIRKNRLNLAVANYQRDRTEIGPGEIWLVKPDGGTVHVKGDSDEVARAILDFSLRSADTHWATSRAAGHLDEREAAERLISPASDLLAFALNAKLLRANANGNVTNRAAGEKPTLWVTPRGRPDKSRLTAADLILVEPDLDKRDLAYRCGQASPTEKPSIDSYVNALLYDAMPNLQATLHFHDAWVLGDVPRTRLDFPCGSAEEAGSTKEAVAHYFATKPLGHSNDCLMVELKRHGHLLLLFDHHAALKHLAYGWMRVEAAYYAHLKDVSQEAEKPHLSCTPIFDRENIIGLAATHRDGWSSFFLLPTARKRGTGAALLRLIDERGTTVGVHHDCQIEDYYRDHGFQVLDRTNGLAQLGPPSRRDDVIDAATVRIRCATTGRILLLRRGQAPWLDHWANPGGCFQSANDTSLWATACRETAEETGLDLTCCLEPPQEKQSAHVMRGLCPDGYERTYRTTCFQVDVLREYVPTIDGDEVREARWFTPDEARALLMGRATREVLRLSVQGF